jgi:general stress protein YciG
MADPKNPGQFGNRSDTEERASEGGQASSGSFEEGSNRASEAGKASSGSFEEGSSRASEAGEKGAKAQPKEAKRRGGKNSSRG